jgi:predicted MFS family arabinose efflux permease
VGLLAGTLGFAAVAGAVPSGERRSSPIRLPGVVTLVVATALADVGLGGVDVVVTAFAEARGRPELAGVLLALFCVGAVVGAVAYGARRWPGGVDRHLVALMLLGAATLAVLAVPQTLVAMAVVIVLAGPSGAAQWAAASLALDRASGGSAGAEAYTWLSAANGVGIAAGSVLCGAAVEAWGTDAAFLLAAGGPLLAAAVVAGRRATLAA